MIDAMRKNIRMIVGLLLVLGLAAGWFWLERATRPANGEAVGPGAVTTVAGGPSVPTLLPGDASGADAASVSARPAEDLAPNAGAGANPGGDVESAAMPVLTAGDILAEPDEDYVRVAKKLSALALDPRASMADREEALAHALNLSAGNEAEVLTPLVTNPALPDNLTETILAEALNRPLAYQADLYLAALAARKTPEMQKMIREHLAFLVGGEDFGADPKAWGDAITKAKKDWAE